MYAYDMCIVVVISYRALFRPLHIGVVVYRKESAAGPAASSKHDGI
jgi:hypothetical protein